VDRDVALEHRDKMRAAREDRKSVMLVIPGNAWLLRLLILADPASHYKHVTNQTEVALINIKPQLISSNSSALTSAALSFTDFSVSTDFLDDFDIRNDAGLR
jgi:hypothetical protein